MYRATVAFNDLQDNNRSYEAGEKYPRPGIKPTRARLTELSTNKNRMGFPLIEQVTTPPKKRKVAKDDA